MAVTTPWRSKAPAIVRSVAKPRVKFTCTTCLCEVEGWEYMVGFGLASKRPECSLCWATPRIPPMKPLGGMVILG